MVRYRAYSSRGLTAAQVAVLVAITSITFGLGALLIGGIVLVFEPQELRRLAGMLPDFLTNDRRWPISPGSPAWRSSSPMAQARCCG